jgi:hypothetical protein
MLILEAGVAGICAALAPALQHLAAKVDARDAPVAAAAAMLHVHACRHSVTACDAATSDGA